MSFLIEIDWMKTSIGEKRKGTFLVEMSSVLRKLLHLKYSAIHSTNWSSSVYLDPWLGSRRTSSNCLTIKAHNYWPGISENRTKDKHFSTMPTSVVSYGKYCPPYLRVTLWLHLHGPGYFISIITRQQVYFTCVDRKNIHIICVQTSLPSGAFLGEERIG